MSCQNPQYSCETEVCSSGGKMCPQTHCGQMSGSVKDYCTCSGAYSSLKVNGVCPFTDKNGVPLILPDGSACFCCCSCFANGTPVEAPDGFRAVQDFAVGDPVRVADANLVWTERTVEFSDGTGEQPGAYNEMVRVTYENADGETDYLVVTPVHLFWMPDGTLKKAGTLVPGVDRLVRADGSEAPLLELAVGMLQVGVHHIATTTTSARTVDGHLLNSNGIVTADYALQIAGLDEESPARARVADDLPFLGQQEYADRWGGQTEIGPFWSRVPGSGGAAETTEGNAPARVEGAVPFAPHGHGRVEIPEHAQTFLSRRQAEQLKLRAPMYPAGSGGLNAAAAWLFTVYGAFFPDVVFYLDLEADEPNAWSWRQYGTSFVVVSGAMARLVDLKTEGLAVVISHELGHLYGSGPMGPKGYTCEGAADYAGVAVMMRKTWYGALFATMGVPGVEQVLKLFGYLDEVKRPDRCNRVSIDCRVDALQAALYMMPLPYCAGGPDIVWLEVKGASARGTQDEEARITVDFNVPVDPSTATLPENYLLVPPAPVTSAEVDEEEPSRVYLRAALEPGEYGLTVVNVLSDKFQYLFPGRNQAGFEYTPEGRNS